MAASIGLMQASQPRLAPGTLASLTLTNGDRVSGVVIEQDDLRIKIWSAVAGELSVPLAGITAITTPAKDKSMDKLAATVTAPSTPSPANDKSSSSAKPPAKAITAAAPKAKGQPWKRKVEVGFQQQRGRKDTLSYTAMAEAQKTSGDSTYRFHGRHIYGEQNQETNADRTEASARWRYQLEPRVFLQTQSSYYQDGVSQIDHNVEQNVSMGYRLIDRNSNVVNVGGGLTAQYRAAPAIDNGITALSEFFQDYTLQLNSRVSLVQDMNLQYWPEDHPAAHPTTTTREYENYKLRFNAKLRSSLTASVSMNVRYEYEFDNAIANPSARENQRVISSLDYVF